MNILNNNSIFELLLHMSYPVDIEAAKSSKLFKKFM